MLHTIRNGLFRLQASSHAHSIRNSTLGIWHLEALLPKDRPVPMKCLRRILRKFHPRQSTRSGVVQIPRLVLITRIQHGQLDLSLNPKLISTMHHALLRRMTSVHRQLMARVPAQQVLWT